MAFLWPVRVYYEDTDHGGVVYHANYAAYMERGRTEMLRARNIKQSQLIEEQQVIFAVRDLSLNFLKPARFDDLLVVSTEIVQHNRLNLQLEQIIHRVEDNGVLPASGMGKAQGELLCEGRVSIVSLDSQRLRPKRMSRELLEEIVCER